MDDAELAIQNWYPGDKDENLCITCYEEVFAGKKSKISGRK